MNSLFNPLGITDHVISVLYVLTRASASWSGTEFFFDSIPRHVNLGNPPLHFTAVLESPRQCAVCT